MRVDSRSRWRGTYLVSVLVLVAAVLVAASASEGTAHAAFTERSFAGPDGASATEIIPVEERVAARRVALQAEAASIDTQRQAAQLADHEGRERTNAKEIRAESERLRNLGRFAWPTEGGMSSGFGMRRHPILGYTRLHAGADIGGACGNPIYAAQAGTVTRASYGSSSGNNVRIDHGDVNGKSVQTAYLHMTKYVVEAGDQVDKGEVIGYVGTTGLSTACHLHLALYEDGRPSDPLDYLNKDEGPARA